MFMRANLLALTVSHRQLICTQQVEYKVIDKCTTKATVYVEQWCCKIKADSIPWCLLVSKAINKILYWKGVLQQAQGHQIGSSVLATWTKKGRLCHDLNNVFLPTKVINLHITKAYKHFAILKKDPNCHKTWIAGLIKAQPMATNTKKKSLLKKIHAT